ncbi:zinc finger protein 521-like [Arapaima gigas]
MRNPLLAVVLWHTTSQTVTPAESEGTTVDLAYGAVGGPGRECTVVTSGSRKWAAGQKMLRKAWQANKDSPRAMGRSFSPRIPFGSGSEATTVRMAREIRK